MKILLLEDDPILSDIMKENLELSEFTVTLVMDGEEAMKAISNEKFDLFLFDINVPLASGMDVLKFAREYHYETPTIMITAYQDINHLKKSFSLGCDDYIKKPFEYEELEQRIVNIKNLRNIVGKEHIKTIRGTGYCFE